MRAKKAGYNTIDEMTRAGTRCGEDHANNPTTSDLGFLNVSFCRSAQQTLDDLDNFDIATGHFINTSGQPALCRSGFTDAINPFSARRVGRAGRL